jgi:hypothetical protein
VRRGGKLRSAGRQASRGMQRGPAAGQAARGVRWKGRPREAGRQAARGEESRRALRAAGMQAEADFALRGPRPHTLRGREAGRARWAAGTPGRQAAVLARLVKHDLLFAKELGWQPLPLQTVVTFATLNILIREVLVFALGSRMSLLQRPFVASLGWRRMSTWSDEKAAYLQYSVAMAERHQIQYSK